ncbi:MAG: sulfite exporter TauE/SafE family protein [Alphaproteobacteria bacterium]|nr:sulfite exporter TauE/SafE family protein [Alphaproteobacteria bacterium]
MDFSLVSDPVFLAVAIVAVIVVGISKGGFGGGLGVVAVPLLTLLVPPTVAAAIMLPMLCCMDVMGLKAFWGKWNRHHLMLILGGSLIGILIGASGFEFLDDDTIKLLIGLIALGFTLERWIKHRRGGDEAMGSPPGSVSGVFWGGVSGFTSFVAHAGGPPVNAYLLRLGLDKTVYQSTTIIFYWAINLVKLIPYALLGQFSVQVLTTSAVLLPVALFGMFLGMKLHYRVPEKLFYRLCYIFLFLTGIKLTYDGISGFL